MAGIDLDSTFYCVKCGTKGIPIARKTGSLREAGHLKKLYCLKCGKEVNHVETRPFTKYDYKDFVTEYEYGNFTEEGVRKHKYGELKELIRHGKVEKVRTLDDGRSSGEREK